MRGQCLCGKVVFEVDASQLRLYRCHCSLCRRQSGTASNYGAIIESSRFRWLEGQAAIASWTKATGFRSDFCSVCGSPVPNPLRGPRYMWLPAGLFDDASPMQVVADFYLASRAAWDAMGPVGAQFDELPSPKEMLALMHNE